MNTDDNKKPGSGGASEGKKKTETTKSACSFSSRASQERAQKPASAKKPKRPSPSGSSDSETHKTTGERKVLATWTRSPSQEKKSEPKSAKSEGREEGSKASGSSSATGRKTLVTAVLEGRCNIAGKSSHSSTWSQRPEKRSGNKNWKSIYYSREWKARASLSHLVLETAVICDERLDRQEQGKTSRRTAQLRMRDNAIMHDDKARHAMEAGTSVMAAPWR